MGVETLMNFVFGKLKELLMFSEDLGVQFMDWVNKVFPPEVRAEKIRAAVPYLIVAVVLWLLMRCCVRCCCGRRESEETESLLLEVYDYDLIRMMKAPGRNCVMPRAVFEADPKLYFRNLRAYPGVSLV